MCIHMYTLTHRGVGRGGNIGPPSLLPLQNIGGFVCSHPPLEMILFYRSYCFILDSIDMMFMILFY